MLNKTYADMERIAKCTKLAKGAVRSNLQMQFILWEIWQTCQTNIADLFKEIRTTGSQHVAAGEKSRNRSS